jgi:hypothetical protein
MYGFTGTLVLVGLIAFLLVERKFFTVKTVPASLIDK